MSDTPIDSTDLQRFRDYAAAARVSPLDNKVDRALRAADAEITRLKRANTDLESYLEEARIWNLYLAGDRDKWRSLKYEGILIVMGLVAVVIASLCLNQARADGSALWPSLGAILMCITIYCIAVALRRAERLDTERKEPKTHERRTDQ